MRTCTSKPLLRSRACLLLRQYARTCIQHLTHFYTHLDSHTHTPPHTHVFTHDHTHVYTHVSNHIHTHGCIYVGAHVDEVWRTSADMASPARSGTDPSKNGLHSQVRVYTCRCVRACKCAARTRGLESRAAGWCASACSHPRARHSGAGPLGCTHMHQLVHPPVCALACWSIVSFCWRLFRPLAARLSAYSSGWVRGCVCVCWGEGGD